MSRLDFGMGKVGCWPRASTNGHFISDSSKNVDHDV